MENDRTVLVNEEKMNTKDILEQAYMELGKEYYEGAFEDPLPQLLPLFEKINTIKNNMSGKSKQKAYVRSAESRLEQEICSVEIVVQKSDK